MAIVVDEVVISVEVAAPAGGAGASRGTAAPKRGPESPAAGDFQTLIQECVERVLDVLARREER